MNVREAVLVLSIFLGGFALGSAFDHFTSWTGPRLPNEVVVFVILVLLVLPYAATYVAYMTRRGRTTP